MKQHIFLKSTVRQPVRTLILLLLIGVIAFAFSVRAAEYLLVKAEVGRLSGYYHSIGELKAIGDDTDAWAAADYMETNPYVKTADNRVWTSGILQDGIYNADLDGTIYSSSKAAISPAASWCDIIFYGVLTASSETGDGYQFRFETDAVVAGYPEYVEAGKPITVLGGLETSEAYQAMKPGERYLLRATFDVFDMRIFSRPRYSTFIMRRLSEEGPWFLDTPTDLDLTQAEYSQIEKERQLVDDNQHALEFIGTEDMSVIPYFQERAHYGYLAEGRFLNSEDEAAASRVCVINKGLAEVRGLEIGDSITVRLRNIYSFFGYQALGESDTDAETQMETFEIVGTYGLIEDQDGTCLWNMVYIPASVIPETFLPMSDIDGTVASFVLTSPKDEDRFLTECQDELAEFGYRAVFQENGWDSFYAAANSLESTAMYNALIFGAIILAALCLACFIYFRFRRKEIAVSRALGLPAGQCAWAAALPVILIGGVGCAGGSVLAWAYVGSHAGETLASLAAFEAGEVSKPAMQKSWLMLIIAALILVVIVLAFAFSLTLVRRSPLLLLQGNTPGKVAPQRSVAAASGTAQPSARHDKAAAGPTQQFSPAAPAEAGWRRSTAGPLGAFIWRHVLRAPVKSLLALLLAGAFSMGLMVIQVAIVRNAEEVDRLYNSISVQVELTTEKSSVYIEGGGYIYENAINQILNSGYISDHYIVGSCLSAKIQENIGYYKWAIRARDVQMTAFDDPDRFFAERDSYEITYFRGWDDNLFRQVWEDGSANPVVIPRSLYEAFEAENIMQLGISSPNGLTTIPTATIAGVYDGPENDILMPISVMQLLCRENMVYSKAVFIVDPARNREMDAIKTRFEEIIGSPYAGKTDISAIFWDQELRQSVEPMEQVGAFMRVLYPITIAVSVLVAAGIAVLLTLTLAKEVAILRVLGNRKGRCRVVLCAQTVIPCIAGSVLGCLGAWLLAWLAVPVSAAGLMPAAVACAALYLAATLLGGFAGAVGMTTKNPLELLQVKE